MAKTYEDAGVNLEAGYEVVRRIKQHVASTSRVGSMGNIGSFGGMFDLASLGIKEPVIRAVVHNICPDEFPSAGSLQILGTLPAKRADFAGTLQKFGRPPTPPCSTESLHPEHRKSRPS